MLFDSIRAFSAASNSLRILGIATVRSPVRVLTHSDRTAPAARYREESFPLAVSFSSPTATANPPVSPHGSTLIAVHRISGKPRISPSTTLVLPTLRDCPPTTTIAIQHLPLLQPSQVSQILLQRTRRPSPENLALPPHLLPAQYSRAASQNHTLAHRRMLADPHLPAQDRAILHHTRARDPRLSRNHYILPNQAVVPDVHQVVDLCPAPDPRLSQRP